MFQRLFLFLISLVVILSVTVARADIYKTGEGPIRISLSTLTGFEKYKLEAKPLYFAVANDGRGYGYTQCPPYYSSCSDDTGDRARELCDRKAGLRGAECFIFAIDTEVVWKGPVTYPDFGDDYLVLFAKGAIGRSTHWGGKGKSIDGGRKITLRVRKCRGVADTTTKKWYLKECKDNYSAHGTFVTGSGNEKYYGVGKDTGGEDVVMKILVPDSSGGKISKGKKFHPTIPTSVKESAIAKYKAIDSGILSSGKSTHKAFAASEGGSYGHASNRTIQYGAVISAFMNCKKHSTSCRLYDLDDKPIEGLGEQEAYKWAKLEDLKARPDKELCNLVANPEEKPLKWDEIYAKEFVEEAKRRKLTVNDCKKILDIDTATPEKPSSPSTNTTATPPPTEPSPAVKPPQPLGSGSVEERLAKLKELLEKGLLTPDEAAAKRKEIIKGL